MTDGIPLPPITEENRLTQLLLAGWKSMDPIKRAYYVMQLRLLHHRASLEGNEKQGRVLAKKKTVPGSRLSRARANIIHQVRMRAQTGRSTAKVVGLAPSQPFRFVSISLHSTAARSSNYIPRNTPTNTTTATTMVKQEKIPSLPRPSNKNTPTCTTTARSK